MALVRKNIWLIFYIFLLFALFFLGIVSYLKWGSIYTKHQIAQENMVKLIRSSTHSLFATQEMLLDILGRRFVEDENYKDNRKAMKTLDDLLVFNSSIFAFGLLTPEGDYTFLSSHTNLSKLPNLREQAQSKDSFLDTLASRHMVIGRTYYFKPLHEWVIPIRKAIRDDKGKILAVMTGALKVQDTFEPFIQSLHNRENYVFSIIREGDFYSQYRSDQIQNGNVYDEPVSKQMIDTFHQIIFDTYTISPNDLRKDEPIVSFMVSNNEGYSVLASLQYDKTYQLWTIVQTYYSVIVQEFLESFAWYCVIFVVMSISFFWLFRMVSKAESKRTADLFFQATHDLLTALPNRSYLHKNINIWIQEAIPFSIFYLDIDNFKNINDNFGHEFGDRLLVELTHRLKKHIPHIPKEAIIIRYGGDEFLIFTYVVENTALLDFASRLIDIVSKPYVINNLSFTIGASVGIAKYPEHGRTLNTLIRAADIAMYESKKIKNTAHLFTNTMQEGYLKNLAIEHALQTAIENNEFYMVYQPQINADGSLHGVEALTRWNNPSLGFIPPDVFIAIAEISGLMPKIGRFITETSLAQIKEIQELCSCSFQISINISIRQFMDLHFLDHLLDTLQKTTVSKVSITLEVTENLFIEDLDYILPLLQKVRDLGIAISMDDFGTGYSSLSMLRKLPIHELKIDKSFVDEICHDEAARKMVQNIITIGKNLTMQILAEGVETKEQKELLIVLGCDRFQGYYFSKPLTKDALISFLQKTTLPPKDS